MVPPAGARAPGGLPAPASRSASAETHTTRAGSRPRRWAPARAWPPSAPLGLEWWGCRAAADGRQPWECTAAGPAAGDTCRRATPRRGRRASARRRIVRPPPASPDRRRPRRDSDAPGPTLPGGRHPSRSDPAARETGVPGTAWPRPTGSVEGGALCRWVVAHRGSWDRTCRPCPRTCPRHSPDHRRGPSLPSRCSSRQSAVLRPPRTPAAHASFSPSAYTSAPAPTRAAQTGLSCSVPLPARVLRPLPRRDHPRVRPRTGARTTWPSPGYDRLGSRIVNLSRLQASRHVAARVLASSVEAFDTPLGPRGSHRTPGVCYSALRGLPRRDSHPLERDSGRPAVSGWPLHDAPYMYCMHIASGRQAHSHWSVDIV